MGRENTQVGSIEKGFIKPRVELCEVSEKQLEDVHITDGDNNETKNKHKFSPGVNLVESSQKHKRTRATKKYFFFIFYYADFADAHFTK